MRCTSMPTSLECAVIGVPHEKWGETPKALVVLASRAAIADSRSSYSPSVASCMAHFKSPTSIDLVAELPRTATGKLQKFKLREAYWGKGQRRVN